MSEQMWEETGVCDFCQAEGADVALCIDPYPEATEEMIVIVRACDDCHAERCDMIP